MYALPPKDLIYKFYNQAAPEQHSPSSDQLVSLSAALENDSAREICQSTLTMLEDAVNSLKKGPKQAEKMNRRAECNVHINTILASAKKPDLIKEVLDAFQRLHQQKNAHELDGFVLTLFTDPIAILNDRLNEQVSSTLTMLKTALESLETVFSDKMDSTEKECNGYINSLCKAAGHPKFTRKILHAFHEFKKLNDYAASLLLQPSEELEKAEDSRLANSFQNRVEVRAERSGKARLFTGDVLFDDPIDDFVFAIEQGDARKALSSCDFLISGYESIKHTGFNAMSIEVILENARNQIREKSHSDPEMQKVQNKIDTVLPPDCEPVKVLAQKNVDLVTSQKPVKQTNQQKVTSLGQQFEAALISLKKALASDEVEEYASYIEPVLQIAKAVQQPKLIEFILIELHDLQEKNQMAQLLLDEPILRLREELVSQQILKLNAALRQSDSEQVTLACHMFCALFDFSKPKDSDIPIARQIVETYADYLYAPAGYDKMDDVLSMIGTLASLLVAGAQVYQDKEECKKYINMLVALAERPLYGQGVLELFVEQGKREFLKPLLAPEIDRLTRKLHLSPYF